MHGFWLTFYSWSVCNSILISNGYSSPFVDCLNNWVCCHAVFPFPPVKIAVIVKLSFPTKSSTLTSSSIIKRIGFFQLMKSFYIGFSLNTFLTNIDEEIWINKKRIVDICAPFISSTSEYWQQTQTWDLWVKYQSRRRQ